MVSTRFPTSDLGKEWRLGRAITLFSRDRFTLAETDSEAEDDSSRQRAGRSFPQCFIGWRWGWHDQRSLIKSATLPADDDDLSSRRRRFYLASFSVWSIKRRKKDPNISQGAVAWNGRCKISAFPFISQHTDSHRPSLMTRVVCFSLCWLSVNPAGSGHEQKQPVDHLSRVFLKKGSS